MVHLPKVAAPPWPSRTRMALLRKMEYLFPIPPPPGTFYSFLLAAMSRLDGANEIWLQFFSRDVRPRAVYTPSTSSTIKLKNLKERMKENNVTDDQRVELEIGKDIGLLNSFIEQYKRLLVSQKSYISLLFM